MVDFYSKCRLIYQSHGSVMGQRCSVYVVQNGDLLIKIPGFSLRCSGSWSEYSLKIRKESLIKYESQQRSGCKDAVKK